MRGASRASFAEAKERLEAALSAGDAARLGDELFSVLRLLDREHVLRRALSDPARPSDQRGGLAAAVLDGKVDSSTAELVADVVRLRWVRSIDLTDGIERLAVIATVASVEASGGLDDLEDELFRFERIVEAQPQLRGALVDRRVGAEHKSVLLAELLEGKTTPATLRLVTEAATHPRGRSLERVLAEYGRIAAERRSRLVAVVRTAVELSEQQKTRLAAALAAQYDRDVHLNIEVDPPSWVACPSAWGTRKSTAPSFAGWERSAGVSSGRANPKHRTHGERRRRMAELTIRPEEIRSALERFVQAYEPDAAAREEVGTVVECFDGIAFVEGLPSAMANELLEFEDGTRGIALNLDVRQIGVVILGDFSKIEEGQQVRRTGEVLSVPIGDGYLGRVVDSLGKPIDGKGEIETSGRRELELQAPGVMQRQPVGEPLQTGIKAIDAMTPIGRGQRQLIIGDRQTGKTTVAIDTILNQKQAGRAATLTSRSAASTSRSVRRVRRSRRCGPRCRTPARWSTPPSWRPRPPTPRATSTSPPTPVRPSASTGCTRASTS